MLHEAHDLLAMIKQNVYSGSKFSKFPAELLTAIFHHVLVDDARPHVAESERYLSTYDHEGKSPNIKPILILSSVCTHWRDVTTRFSALWRRVSWRYTQDRKLLQLYLQRCPTAPALALRADAKDWNPSEDNRYLHEYAVCLRALDLSHGGDPADFAQSLQLTAPHLRSLVLRQGFDTVQTPTHLPREYEILKCSSLSLKAFCCIGGSTFMPSNQFPKLTHLLLDVHSFRRHELFEGVFKLLRRAPLLQSLTLWNINIPDTSSPAPEFDAHAKVHLRTLRFLTMSTFGFTPHFLAILARMSFDPSRVRTRILGPGMPVQVEQSIFNAMAQQCISSKTRNARMHVLVGICDFVFVLDAPTCGFYFSTSFIPTPDSIWISSHSLLLDLPPSIPLESARTLGLVVETLDHSATGLDRTLSRFTDLTELQVVLGPDAERRVELSILLLCGALIRNISLHEPGGPPVSCPLLQSLSISADFSDGETTSECADCIENMLLQRKDRGAAISRLAIQALLRADNPGMCTPHLTAVIMDGRCSVHVDEYVSVPDTDREFCISDTWHAWRTEGMDDDYWRWNSDEDRPDELVSYLDSTYSWVPDDLS